MLSQVDCEHQCRQVENHKMTVIYRLEKNLHLRSLSGRVNCISLLETHLP